MPATTMIAPGFSDPVYQSQAAVRALLAALSEPGTLQQVASEIPGVETVRLYEDYLRNCESTGDI